MADFIRIQVTLLTLIIPSSFWLLSLPLYAQSVDAQAALKISSDRMVADVTTLSQNFNGRQTGTRDDLASAQWVFQRFQKTGLVLPRMRGSQLQFSFAAEELQSTLGIMGMSIRSSAIEPDVSLRISAGGDAATRLLGTDYLPILDSPSAAAQGPIVFVGYGIADRANGLDEYEGIDVRNCVVLFLRGKPDHYPLPIGHADKVRIAARKGAIGYLTATGPVLNAYEARRGITGGPSAFYGLTVGPKSIPGAWISTSAAEEIVGRALPPGDSLKTRQERLNNAPTSQAVRTDRFVSLSWTATPTEGLLLNVVAILRGRDPQLGQEAIVIGAHRDHFGRQAGLVFPGADDNASGTAVMLEVGRVLAQMKSRPKRSILFVSFSGEERGLLGSRFYVGQPVVPLNNTKAMINIDHAGIGNGRLTVGITGLDQSLAQEAGQQAGLADKVDLFGFFPGGDHVPFKEAGIPTVTVVSGGIHPHFHQPSDTAETVNPDILATAARYVLALAWQLANQP